MQIKQVFIILLAITTLTLSTTGNTADLDTSPIKRREQPRGLYSYTAPYNEGNKHRIGIFPSSIAQMTTSFPESNLIDGVIFLLHWSIINPEPNTLRWDIIDNALEFWSQKGKKVAFVISPIGSHIQLSAELGGGVKGPTPNWVLKNVATFISESPIIIDGKREMRKLEFPEYTNPEFLNYYFNFLRKFSERYDSDKRIAFMRIFAGYNGEEVASVNGGKGGYPADFEYNSWLIFQNYLVDKHIEILKRTPLEIDLALTGRTYKNPKNEEMHRTIIDKSIIKFVDKLCELDIAIGNNGLDSNTIEILNDKTASATRIFSLLEYASKKNGFITLETKSPPNEKNMLNTDNIFMAITRINPDRVNVFGSHVSVSDFTNNKHIFNYASSASENRSNIKKTMNPSLHNKNRLLLIKLRKHINERPTKSSGMQKSTAPKQAVSKP